MGSACNQKGASYTKCLTREQQLSAAYLPVETLQRSAPFTTSTCTRASFVMSRSEPSSNAITTLRDDWVGTLIGGCAAPLPGLAMLADAGMNEAIRVGFGRAIRTVPVPAWAECTGVC